jgi:hypothetical protein
MPQASQGALFEVATLSPLCQRQQNRRTSWRDARTDQPFQPGEYLVQRIADDVAAAYVKAHHYSGTYPAAVHRYGLLHADQLVGVAVLSVPVARSVLTRAFPGLEPYRESLELGRFVLDDEVPANGESWLLGQVWKLAAEDGVRGVVSFADPVPRQDAAGRLVMPGHVGVIYQATNAAYCGRGTARTLRLLPDGTVLNDRSLQKVRQQDQGHEYVERQLCRAGARPLRAGEHPATWLRDALDAAKVRRLRHPGNHRYCFRLGTPAQRRKVQLGIPAADYPKRAA